MKKFWDWFTREYVIRNWFDFVLNLVSIIVGYLFACFIWTMLRDPSAVTTEAFACPVCGEEVVAITLEHRDDIIEDEHLNLR